MHVCASAGPNGLCAEYVKYAKLKLSVIFSRHHLHISIRHNYEPIALGTMVSTIF